MEFICSAFISWSLISPMCNITMCAKTLNTTKVQLWGFTSEENLCKVSPQLSKAELAELPCARWWPGGVAPLGVPRPGRGLGMSGCSTAPYIIPVLWVWMLVAQRKGSWGDPQPSCHKVLCLCLLMFGLNLPPAAFSYCWWLVMDGAKCVAFSLVPLSCAGRQQPKPQWF